MRKKEKDSLVNNPPQEVKSGEGVTGPEFFDLKSAIMKASAEINKILVENGLEMVVSHQFRVNPDLKQEEIVHEISLKPKK